MSNTITSYSLASEAQWPNVTLPNFDIRTTDSFEKLAGPEVFIFAPVVTKDNLLGYEKYAWDNQVWIRQDLALRGLGKVDPGFINTKVYPWIDGQLEEHLNAQVHVPIWQVGPVPTKAEIVNLDLYSHPSFQRMIDECMEVRHLLLSEVVDRSFISDNLGTLDNDEALDVQPRSYAIQPVFRDFAWDSELVGFIFAVVPWWTYFVDVLPVGTDGYIVEVQDTCGLPFFYRLDGPDATYLGQDITPNPEYADIIAAHEFAEFARYSNDDTADQDNVLHCSYRIVVHPSDELKETYQTNEPMLYTVVVVCVFALTVMVFLLYDYFVQRRNDQVMLTATKTASIVSSLFPKTIQSRIMEEVEEGQKRRTGSFSGKDLLKNYMSGKLTNKEEATDGNGVFGSKPIADFFPVRVQGSVNWLCNASSNQIKFLFA